MTTLAKLQRNFISDCLSGKLTEENTRLAKDIDTQSISASGLMGIYQTSAIGNIINSMKLTYPVIEKLVGDVFFRAMCKQYILSHWPKTANMDDYGSDFAHFLSEFEHVNHLIYLEDVARLEWLFHQSSLANDALTTDWKLLAKVSESEVLKLKFELAPSVALIKSDFPIEKIWRMNQLNAPQEGTIEILDSETLLLLYRDGFKIEMKSLSKGEFELLGSFLYGKTFEQAIKISTDAENDFSIQVALNKYIEQGVVCGFAH